MSFTMKEKDWSDCPKFPVKLWDLEDEILGLDKLNARKKVRPVVYGPEYVIRRQQGRRNPFGSSLAQMHQYASSYDFDIRNINSKYGGVFNLQYSPSGSVLAAATEMRGVLIFDAAQQKQIKAINEAHEGCINSVNFIDSNSFLTCSDDCTVSLWDLRHTSSAIHIMRGHKNWVKNVHVIDGGFLSSSFDGFLCTWDIKNCPGAPRCHPVLRVDGLMRSRLSPDGTKLVVTTAAGFILVIHNFNLPTLNKDLKGFIPNLYRLMQMRNQTLRSIVPSTEYFQTYGRRNRIEFISDFPSENDAEIIASLAIFPDGNHILTRNTAHSDANEYTCVHQINELEEDEGEVVEEKTLVDVIYTHKSATPVHVLSPNRENSREDSGPLPPNDVWEAWVTVAGARVSRAEQNVIYIRASRRPAIRRGRGLPESAGDGVMRMSFEENETLRRNDYAPAASETVDIDWNVDINDYPPLINEPPPPSFFRSLDQDIDLAWYSERRPSDERIYLNKKRIIGYIPEPNIGKGFIKEQVISPDGRFIVSPYNNGIRILTFSPSFTEPLLTHPSTTPQQLKIVKEISIGPFCDNSGKFVCCSAISPYDKQIAAGTLSGNIAFFNPLRE